MPIAVEDRERQVIPKWRSFKVTLGHHDLAPLATRETSQFDQSLLAKLHSDWLAMPTPSVAADFVSVAYSLDIWGIADEAAGLLIRHGDSLPVAKAVAERYLMKGGPGFHVSASPPQETKADIYRRISVARRQLAEYPTNPVLWTNLALYYTILGLPIKADRSIRIALSLAPANRFVLRSAARFYLHHNRGPLAHRLLTQSPLVHTDPWIMAAEIAVAAANSRTSDRIKAARRRLEAEQFTPFHSSELASAIGTLELKDGNRKVGRRLLRQSLESPSENSIAQASWLVRQTHLQPESLGGVDTARSAEANAWRTYANAEWTSSLSHAEGWLNDQPFSSRPAILASYIATLVLEDHAYSEAITRRGLVSNPDDFTLLNNLSFALIQQGQVDQAKVVLQSIQTGALSPESRITYDATWGLLYLRTGSAERGRRLYGAAIAAADRLGSERGATARIMLASEELRLDSPNVRQLVGEALTAARSTADPSIALLASKLERESAKVMDAP